ncbi:metallophosphoesterase [Kitasatospora sp. NPDC056783]|uniref:metallophosphoesterase n=1 Tax=Kitasatospora sp. NPDC056783 TaxID=3345943 RepID=UPI003696F357
MLTIAHLSDIHLGQIDGRGGGKRARRRAEQVMAYLDALPGPLDVVLVTGDLADHGLPEEYRAAALFCGHPHTPAATTFAGLPLLIAPGVVSTVTPPCEAGPGISFDHPPMPAFHVLDGERRLTTHYRALPVRD